MIETILIGVVIAVASIILLIILIGAIKSIKAKKKNKAEKALTSSESEALQAKEEEKKVEPMKVVIAQGDSIVVGSQGRIPCGEYTMESCDGVEAFNVRIGRYVREYKNGCSVVLTENQKVTAVSTSIILR